MRNRNTLPPEHPGALLAEHYLVPMHITGRALAAALKVSPSRIAQIIAGYRGISTDTALRLARYFGTTPWVWLDLQAEYEMTWVRRDAGDEIAAIQPLPECQRSWPSRAETLRDVREEPTHADE